MRSSCYELGSHAPRARASYGSSKWIAVAVVDGFLELGSGSVGRYVCIYWFQGGRSCGVDVLDRLFGFGFCE